jgi:hypothetical protein
MFYGRASAFLTLAVVTVVTLPAESQLVISTRSGIVHFFQGTVYLNEQPLESHPGRFSTVPNGGVLRTAEGRAEVLLKPGVFLRIGERSTIRMVDNELLHTRVELVAGSAVVDSEQPISATSVTLTYTKWSVRFLDQGVYRIDSDPPRLWVLEGKAEVCADNHEAAISVGKGMDMPFAQVLLPEKSINPPRDAFSSWAEGRRQSILADNAIAANIQDPGSMDLGTSGPDSFTYFPALGLAPIVPDLSSSNISSGLYQSGFNSIYLPGYTFLPVLGLGYGFLPVHSPLHPHPIPVHPIYPYPIAVRPVYPYPTPIRQPTPIRPVYSHPTLASPVHPAPTTVHAGAPIGAHVGIHR